MGSEDQRAETSLSYYGCWNAHIHKHNKTGLIYYMSIVTKIEEIVGGEVAGSQGES